MDDETAALLARAEYWAETAEAHAGELALADLHRLVRRGAVLMRALVDALDPED